MPKRIYPGPSGGVTLTLPDGSTLNCPRGEPVEIPAELVDGLQGWETPSQQGPTVPELRQQLKDLGVPVPATAKKADLEQLLAEKLAPAGLAGHPDPLPDLGENPDNEPSTGDDTLAEEPAAS